MSGSVETSGSFHGSDEFEMKVSASRITGVRCSIAIRAASSAVSKQPPGGGDLVLRLDRPHAELLVSRERVQQLRGRRDRVARVEELEARLHARRDQAERERLGAVDVAVGAGRGRSGLDLVARREQL